MQPRKIFTLLLIIILCLFVFNTFTFGKGKGKAQLNLQQQRVVHAVRTKEAIKLDGHLKESVWKGKGYSNFIQADPNDGQPASQKTVVWVAYDDKAIYISARLYEEDPSKISSRLGRRDQWLESDWFLFSVDPYYDKRSGYQFAVTPAGSMVDWTIYNDENRDSSWDGIWECKTRIDDKGWVVEMKIPFDQLRFKSKDHYTWGVNFRRFINRNNEKAGLVWIPKEESGYVSHFARLEGIKGIKPKRVIEMVPYTIGKAAFSPNEEGNPFATGRDFLGNGGIDMKVGLKSNLTLDLTVNPDFGQVEVDPAVINLSAAESYYGERRPFFIEGANIFRFGRGGVNFNVGANWSDPRFFYSRRIGRSPQGSVDTDGYVQYPDWATILGAAKITGKLGEDWNIGVLSALTQREYAQVDLEGNRFKNEVEPLSSYNVIRALKEFNKGRQGLGFIATGVLRDLKDPAMKEILNDNAFSFGLDGWTALDKEKNWVLAGYFGTSRVSGSKERIWDLQHSYPHYFQRPDATHMELDENATTMSGWTGRLKLVKQKGNWVINAALGAISPGFDTTDMGFQWSGDIINGHLWVGYRSYKVGKIFRRWDFNLLTQRNYDFGGNKTGDQWLVALYSGQFKNWWEFWGQISFNARRWDKGLTRGGPLVRMPTTTWASFNIASDNRQPMVFSTSVFLKDQADGTWSWELSPRLTWNPGSNFSLTIRPGYERGHTKAQYVTTVEDEFMSDTYGSRYVFGTIDQKILSCSIRLNWIFSPKLSFQAYIQPFIAVGAYSGLKELSQPRTFDFYEYGGSGSNISYSLENEEYIIDPDGSGPAPLFYVDNPDFNYKSLRGTLVVRWEYRPGSTLYVVWTQNRADYENPGDFRFGRDFQSLLNAPGDNIFMVKFTYRFKL